jgi:hypothetical protein
LAEARRALRFSKDERRPAVWHFSNLRGRRATELANNSCAVDGTGFALVRDVVQMPCRARFAMSPRDRQVYAADWFIRAAALPCSLILAAVCVNEPPGSVSEFLVNFLIILAGPAVIAGGWGAALGAAILEPAATRGAGQAALRGLAVSGASFLTYIFVVSFGIAGLGFNNGNDVLKLFILLLVYGTIMVGWLMAAVGALAGALLYKKVEGKHVPAGDNI